MNPHILYSRFSAPTGRALAAALGYTSSREPVDPKKISHLIRWGCTLHSDLDLVCEKLGIPVFNKSVQTREIVNRHHMLNHLRGIGGRSHSLMIHAQYNGGPEDTGWVARHRFGRWGTDIIDLAGGIPTLSNAAWDGYFLVETWLADYEVRVHIIDGTSVSFQIKCRKDDNGDPIFGLQPAEERGKFVIRNDRNNWHLFPLSTGRARELGINKAPMRELAKNTMRGLGLNFGCVDFLVRVPGGHWNPATIPQEFKIIEVNTSPGLDGQTLDAYVSGLRQLVESNEVVTPEDERSAAAPDVTNAVPVVNGNNQAHFTFYEEGPPPPRDRPGPPPPLRVRAQGTRPAVFRTTAERTTARGLDDALLRYLANNPIRR